MICKTYGSSKTHGLRFEHYNKIAIIYRDIDFQFITSIYQFQIVLDMDANKMDQCNASKKTFTSLTTFLNFSIIHTEFPFLLQIRI